MEEKQNKIWFVTLVLTIIAGYCDTITFVAADKIFSAHVTGNFIVFAYQLVKGAEGDAWIKLLSFPVFMLAVMTDGWIAARFSSRHFVLCCEGVILILAGLMAYSLGYIENAVITWPMYLVTMVIVFAMGLQNAFGKLFAKETYGPTTMMTGNATQFALDIRLYLVSGIKSGDYIPAIGSGLVTLGGFLTGCFLGAYIGKLFGLAGVVIPGLAMVACYFYTRPAAEFGQPKEL
ncbi:Uncharacterized membrane protein YoaK, UPF0700 family [Pedobacter westerhofensis]|uniref:Uncharacterized membrane protein YoaK, UPF0700 family n=1 Tax=Pedobacter westerhofensis TaxID=425512 RepID=A0A521BFR2_9SPHI|nr:YoaK family protein [Pedobacter westerhofensis]SMO45913.1 Uncharacterized membrane protein YoaK, UPF0700 family [Pedobacter westerhofensis]